VPLSNNRLYVIFHGWLTSDVGGEPNADALAIAEAKPGILIAPFLKAGTNQKNISGDVLSLLGAKGISVFPYVPTHFGQRGIGEVAGEIDQCLQAGVAGIFLDEVSPNLERADLEAGYAALHSVTGSDAAKIILNTGVARTGEEIMDIADILMVEHQWRWFAELSPWRSRYPTERFMGCSSNEPGALPLVGRPISRSTAVEETLDAWDAGIGWHYSTDRYTGLPSWFNSYVEGLENRR
jgi:hypothetical protein